jgi:hypothetical protein
MTGHINDKAPSVPSAQLVYRKSRLPWSRNNAFTLKNLTRVSATMFDEDEPVGYYFLEPTLFTKTLFSEG